MKKYIGTKEVKAQPMNSYEASQKGYKTGKADRIRNGYEVEYEDGYKSWSPAEPFEKAYKVAETFKDRLIIERKELAARLEKLVMFMDSPKFAEVVADKEQSELLAEQRDHMGEYLNILNKRIKLLCE